MIEVNHLSYTYPGTTRPVLHDLSFQIAPGEIFGFLGPSGAGKSTTQRILYKILHNFTGEISIKGKPLSQWGRGYYHHIGVGFELPNHYLKLTGRENLALFAAFYPRADLRHLPELFASVGLEDSIDQKVETYSKGMKMRLNFIRALLHDPEIFFFDEPTEGLDPGNARLIRDHILQLRQAGKTIFITTHNMYVADALCDRVAFIVEGELRATDRPASLKRRYGREVVSILLRDGRKAEFPLVGLGDNEQFLAFLRQGELQHIRTLEATLEEVFLQVTGKSLQP